MKETTPKSHFNCGDCWNVAMTTVTIVTIAELVVLNDTIEKMQTLRYLHLFMALIFGALLLWKRKTWKNIYSVGIFVSLYVPFYFFIWNSHIIRAQTPEPWVPFLSIKLHLFAIAYLIPGPYWINLLLILGFLVEFIILWFKLDISNSANAVLMFEPQMTLLSGVASIVLLSFRYFDQELIGSLISRSVKFETYQELTRVFLTLRDRMNTPLQSILVMIQFLKNEKLPTKHLPLLEQSTDELIKINKMLQHLHPDSVVQGRILMTDDEIKKVLDTYSEKQ